MKTLVLSLIVAFFVPFKIRAQSVSFDTSRLYKSTLANIQLYQCQKALQKEAVNLEKGDLDIYTLNPLMGDTGMFFEIKFKSLGAVLPSDTNYQLIAYNFTGLLYSHDRQWIEPLDQRDYDSKLGKEGLILYYAGNGRYDYISGALFVSNTQSLFKLLCQTVSYDEALKKYASLRLFNYRPEAMVINHQYLSFYSLSLKKQCKLAIDQLVNWPKGGKLDVLEL